MSSVRDRNVVFVSDSLRRVLVINRLILNIRMSGVEDRVVEEQGPSIS